MKTGSRGQVMSELNKKVFLCCFVEMWERFSYYGMRALLVLFLTSQLGFTDPKAYALYSLFAALGYAGPVAGGYLADRFLGFKRMVILGGVIMTIGHLCLAMIPLGNWLLYLGLGFVCIGTGMFKGNISNLLGCCYEKDSPDRDRGFTWFYVGVNIGSFLASISCGYVAHWLGWHYGFGLAGLGMILGLLVFLRYQSLLGDTGGVPVGRDIKKPVMSGITATQVIVMSCLLACLVSAIMLNFSEMFSKLLIVAGVIALGVYVKFTLNSEASDRRNLMVLGILMIFFACFFAMEMQLASLIALFTERNVEKEVFGILVPASVSQAINPISIVILGPVCTMLFKAVGQKRSMLRFFSGLVALVMCFSLLYFACLNPDGNGKVSYAYYFLSITLMGLGELCIAPFLMSLSTVLAPEKMKGFVMGFVMFSLAFSNLLGLAIINLLGIDASNAKGTDAFSSLEVYKEGFFDITIFMAVVALAFLAIYPYVNKVFLKQIGLEEEEKEMIAAESC